jgi:hypothetical protein
MIENAIFFGAARTVLIPISSYTEWLIAVNEP